MTVGEIPKFKLKTLKRNNNGNVSSWAYEVVDETSAKKAAWTTKFNSDIGGDKYHTNMSPAVVVYTWTRIS